MVTHVIDFSTVSKNPLNPLGSKLRAYILQELQSATSNPTISSIVVFGGSGPHFSAGADLTEFSSVSTLHADESTSSTLIDVVNAIEASPKPVVAAISGACLGGGLEVALACHYRVAHSKRSKLGLPEVHVGVIPGAGGTQRLPRLLGLQRALQMILTGVPVNASQALKMKLIDAMVDDEDPKQLLNKAKEWARWAEVMPIRRTSQMKVPEDAAAAHVICHVASLSLPQHGNTGVQAALKACRASYTLPFGKGMQLEHELFVQVLLSAQGQAHRHAFFAVRKAQKTLSSSVPHHPLLSETGVSTAVVGVGTMGAGIALVLLQSGFKVHLSDISPLALQRGRQTIEGIVQRGCCGKYENQSVIVPQARSNYSRGLHFAQQHEHTGY